LIYFHITKEYVGPIIWSGHGPAKGQHLEKNKKNKKKDEPGTSKKSQLSLLIDFS
jgi:hypothetical protein